MISAFDGYAGLDRAATAWEMKGMERVRRGAQGLADPQRSYRCWAGAQPSSARSRATPRRSQYRGLCLVVVLVAAAAMAGAACRVPQASDGVGGQSGDEGRRMNAGWLGTGGVASMPTRP